MCVLVEVSVYIGVHGSADCLVDFDLVVSGELSH